MIVDNLSKCVMVFGYSDAAFFRNFLDKQATFRGCCGLPPGRVQEETPTATVRKPQETKGPLISLGVVIAMGFLKLFFV